MGLHAGVIAVSAFLLFLVQPLIARQILPWFGGSAAVWTTCMVFFQLVLLAGYAYADLLVRRCTPRTQALVHTMLVAASLAALPILPSPSLAPPDGANPVGRILLLLAITIGLPYLVLSTTGPLVQAWFSRGSSHGGVYRLYALSNAASMAALIAYPPLIEPNASTRWQALGWSGGYLVFAVLVVALAWRSLRTLPQPSVAARDAPGHTAATVAEHVDAAPPTWSQQGLWLLLAALGSVLLLAVTTHLTQNIASIPFLWVLPLALYLGSFILCFDGRGWYWRNWYLVAAAVFAVLMLGGLEWRLASGPRVERGLMHIEQAVPVYALGLFVLCMFLHGELVMRKPPPAWLTRFYLMVSLGGALGGVAVGIVAPLVSNWTWELPIALTLAPVLAGALGPMPMRWLGAAATAGCIALFVAHVGRVHDDAIELSRNAYGTLRVKATADDRDPLARWRLMHGVITHGEQYRSETLRRRATTYYGETSGIGRAIEGLRGIDGERPQRLGLVGLGVGTLASYGRAGDTVRIYELNPAVIELAHRRFSYLDDSRAQVETPLGDARLTQQREPPQDFDVLAVDAFSSDAIPVHLLTREAALAYRRHLRPGGVIALHISNRYLDLSGVARQLADDLGLQAIRVIDDPPDESDLYRSDWVLITGNDALVRKLRDEEQVAIDVPRKARQQPWTDDYNNLFQVLK